MVLTILLTLLMKVGQYLVEPIAHRLGYLFHYNKKVENFRKQAEQLNSKRDSMQQRVNAATRNGEEILIDVSKWLENADEVLSEAEELDVELKLKGRCFNVLCPDFNSRYKLGKIATKKTEAIKELHVNADFGTIAVSVPPGLNSTYKLSKIATEKMEAIKDLQVNADFETIAVSVPPGFNSGHELSKIATKKMEAIKELQVNADFGTIAVSVPPPITDLILKNDLVTFDSSESTIYQILEALQDDNCYVIGVHGMGGIGKTTIVKEVGRRAKEFNLFGMVVMAEVSQTPDLRRIQGQIADTLGLHFKEETETGRAGQLFKRLKSEKNIIVILDDIWTAINLEAIGIPRGEEHMGCKIILTTRRLCACTDMGNNVKTIPLSFLSIQESLALFKKYSGTVTDSQEVSGLAMEVAKECEGLPLALVTVGRALREKDVREWKVALKRLQMSKSVGIDDTGSCLFSCLKLSYEYLRSEEVKEFFLICSLFPEDHDIQIEDLARFGLGKRLFSDMDTMDEARTRSHEITKYLQACCLLLDSDKDGCVKMHDMVRDLAISISCRGDKMFLVKAGVGLTEWPNKDRFEDYICVSLMRNDIKKLPATLKCPKLQVLLGGNEGFEEFPDSFLRGMTEIEVLDLSERVGIRSLLP